MSSPILQSPHLRNVPSSSSMRIINVGSEKASITKIIIHTSPHPRLRIVKILIRANPRHLIPHRRRIAARSILDPPTLLRIDGGHDVNLQLGVHLVGVALGVFDGAVQMVDLVAAQPAPLAVGLHAVAVDGGDLRALFEGAGGGGAGEVDGGTSPETACWGHRRGDGYCDGAEGCEEGKDCGEEHVGRSRCRCRKFGDTEVVAGSTCVLDAQERSTGLEMRVQVRIQFSVLPSF